MQGYSVASQLLNCSVVYQMWLAIYHIPHHSEREIAGLVRGLQALVQANQTDCAVCRVYCEIIMAHSFARYHPDTELIWAFDTILQEW